ncbi:MAG: DUF4164 family protein [Pseudomonadota bacterium]
MTGQRTEKALVGLEAALVRLEAATSRNAAARQTTEAAADELARAAHDRSRLADALDDAEARARKMAAASREVEARLVVLMESVRKMAPPTP